MSRPISPISGFTCLALHVCFCRCACAYYTTQATAFDFISLDQVSLACARRTEHAGPYTLRVIVGGGAEAVGSPALVIVRGGALPGPAGGDAEGLAAGRAAECAKRRAWAKLAVR